MSNTSATGGYLTPSVFTASSGGAINSSLNHLFRGVTGIPGNLVRPRWQNEPLPIPAIDVDWLAFGVVRRSGEGGSPFVRHIPDGDGKDEVQSASLTEVLVSAYGPNCAHYAEVIRVGLTVLQNWEEVLPLGVNLLEVGDIISLPELVNNEWYDRADLLITLRVAIRSEYPILNILSADGIFSGNRPMSDEVVQQTFDTENVA